MILVLIQIVVPILLIAAVAIPTTSRVLKAAETIATGLYVLAVQLAGLWLDLPFWIVWLLWFLFAAALLIGWRRRSQGQNRRWMSAIAIAGCAALGLLAGWVVLIALIGRTPAAGPVIDLAFPLPPGNYLVVNGGNSSIINAHLETLHPQTPRQALYRGQSYGVDIIALRRDGRQTIGWQPSNPRDYAIFGTAVLAPCEGRVIQSRNDRPDMMVPIPDENVMEGNHVVLRCGSVHVLLAHFRRGSVLVRAGALVRKGQKIGAVGNSGNSGAPHLHIHAQRPGPPDAIFSANPLPIRLNGHYPVRGDRL